MSSLVKNHGSSSQMKPCKASVTFRRSESWKCNTLETKAVVGDESSIWYIWGENFCLGVRSTVMQLLLPRTTGAWWWNHPKSDAEKIRTPLPSSQTFLVLFQGKVKLLSCSASFLLFFKNTSCFSRFYTSVFPWRQLCWQSSNLRGYFDQYVEYYCDMHQSHPNLWH